MEASSQKPSFSTIDPFALTPSESLLPTNWARLPHGVNALVGRSHTTGSTFGLPGFDENLLFIHLQHRMHVELKMDRRFVFDSSGGTATIIPRGHRTNWYTEGTAEALVMSMPHGLFSRTVLRGEDLDLDGCELRPVANFGDPLIAALGQAIGEQLRGGGPLGELYLESLLFSLTLHLIRVDAVRSAKAVERKGGLSPNVLRRIREYIECNLDHELSLVEIADLAQYSPYYLTRCFRESTGQSLYQFVLDRRLERAKHYLQTTDFDLSEISLLSGFTTHSQFTSHFKRKYQVTPSQFRRQLLS